MDTNQNKIGVYSRALAVKTSVLGLAVQRNLCRTRGFSAVAVWIPRIFFGQLRNICEQAAPVANYRNGRRRACATIHFAAGSPGGALSSGPEGAELMTKFRSGPIVTTNNSSNPSPRDGGSSRLYAPKTPTSGICALPLR